MANPEGNQIESVLSTATFLACLLACGDLDDVALVEGRSVRLWKIVLEGFLVVVMVHNSAKKRQMKVIEQRILLYSFFVCV